ncbi:MAG: hypothetical protein F6K09_34285 [Merismopedia sp. SIO2A8]|nr:hypothetical protein [Merismopedia sp. SIO2A8]
MKHLALTNLIFWQLENTTVSPKVKTLQFAPISFDVSFQEKFHLVIYDTPNLLDYTDANFVAANTDGILMVVKMGETKQSLVKQALNQLNIFGLPILGIVANSVKTSSLADSSQSPPKSFQVEAAQQWAKAMQKPS